MNTCANCGVRCIDRLCIVCSRKAGEQRGITPSDRPSWLWSQQMFAAAGHRVVRKHIEEDFGGGK